MAAYTKNQLKQIYDFAYAYLQKRAQQQGISPHELEKYFNPLNNIFTPNATLDTVYDRFLISLQNRNSMPNVIKYNQHHDEIRKQLNIAQPNGYKNLINADINELINKFNAKSKLWQIWLQGAVDAANYLSQFADLASFKTHVENKGIKIIDELCRITGMGTALACDFLKEIGYTQYAKPDRHIIYFVENLGLIDKLSPNKELLILNIIKEMADAANVTAYQVDKIFWLIATENFYLDSNKHSLRETFIQSYNKEK